MTKSAKHPGGRPEKLTKQIQDVIVESLKAGNYVETAAAFAGIHKATLYDWLKKGANQSSGKFREFSDAVKKAQAWSEDRDVKLIANAAGSQWQAAAWRLERRFPDRWGRRERHEVSGPGGEPIAVVSVAESKKVVRDILESDFDEEFE